MPHLPFVSASLSPAAALTFHPFPSYHNGMHLLRSSANIIFESAYFCEDMHDRPYKYTSIYTCKYVSVRHTHTNALSLGLLLHLFSVKNIFLEIFSLSKTRHQHAISRLNGLHLHTATHNTHSCRIYRLVGLACGFSGFFSLPTSCWLSNIMHLPQAVFKKK